jgi:hypothetical protein
MASKDLTGKTAHSGSTFQDLATVFESNFPYSLLAMKGANSATCNKKQS